MIGRVVRTCVWLAFTIVLASCSNGSGDRPLLPVPENQGANARTRTPPVPLHVLTGAFLYSPDGTTSHGRPFGAYASSLSWAETYSGSAVAATGIKTLYYTNPNRIIASEPYYTSNESTFAHTCGGARITNATQSTTYLMDPSSSALVNIYKSVVNNELTKQHFDAIFDDGPDDFLYLSAMPCNFVPSAWLNAYVAEVKAVGHPVIYNDLGNEGPNGTVSPTIGMNAGTIGGQAELCYSTRVGSDMQYGASWIGMENTEIAMEKQNKMFVCFSSDLNSASTSIPVRLYVYASFLLSYNVSTSLLWEYFSTTSGYTVEPESQLVALSPQSQTPSTISGLLTSTGAYGRTYSACYVAGTYVGPCAAVVNSDNVNSHAFPYTTYHHTLVLSGGGILDGGTISTRGPAPPSKLAPLTGVIAFE